MAENNTTAESDSSETFDLWAIIMKIYEKMHQ